LFQLTRASTAVEGDVGLICLRALVVSLLCFYSVDTVTNILAEVVPQTLINYEHEGDNLTIEGPLHATFRQYVAAVATEEDSNGLRKQLLELVESRQANVSGASLRELLACESLVLGELPYTTGMIKWILTPVHRRKYETYPTRSFRAWSIGVVMSELGFDVSASAFAISTQAQYESQFMDRQHRSGYPDVVLVTASVGHTDLLAPAPTRLQVTIDLKPRLVSIRGVPHIAFRYRADADAVNTKFLCDVFNYSFTHARRVTSTPTLRGGNVHIKVEPHSEVIHSAHKELATWWSVHIEQCLRDPMHQYLPHDDGMAAAVKDCSRRITGEGGEATVWNGGAAVENWCIMTAIVLATILAVCSKAIQADGKGGGEHTEIAFSPDFIHTNKVYKWADVVGRALSGIVSIAEWTGLLLEVVTGVKHSTPVDDPGTNLLSKRWQIIPNNMNQEGTNVSDVFGIQANGVALVSDFLINPSMRPESLLQYHIQYGQLLDIPIDDAGYIRAAKITMPPSTLPTSGRVRLLRAEPPDAEIRIDVEPSWETDPRRIVFKARNKGVPVGTLSPELVSRKLCYSTARCSCSEPTKEIAVTEDWHSVPVSKVLVLGGSRVNFGNEKRVYVPALDDDMSQILCAGLIECGGMTIVRGCLSCALKECSKLTGRVGSIIMIV